MPQSGVGTWRQYPHWARGPARIEGEEVILDEDRAEAYYMFEPTGLLFDFAEIQNHMADGRLDSVSAFVRRYGLLYHGGEQLGTGECREQLEEWRQKSAEIALVADCHARLQECVKRESAELLRTSQLDLVDIHENEDIERSQIFGNVAENDDALIAYASVFLAEAVSYNLRGCDLGVASTLLLDVDIQRPDIYLMTHNPPNLVIAAWAQLASYMYSRAPMHNCPGCGRLFAAKSGKQKYCSPTCANTSRWRRWKEKQQG